MPGDPIIGYITRGRGVSVHRTDCVNIKNADDRGRLIEVEWVKYTNANFVAEINIEAKDARGLMTKVTTVISDQKTTIVSLNVRTSQDYAYINVSFEVKSTRELNQIIKQLKKIPEIVTIHRI